MIVLHIQMKYLHYTLVRLYYDIGLATDAFAKKVTVLRELCLMYLTTGREVVLLSDQP